jgi:hypothetical protein
MMAGVGKADDRQVDHLKERIKVNIGGFDGNAWFNTRKAFYLKIIGLVLGSMTTVIIGISQKGIFKDDGEYFSIAALITSAIVSSLAAWEAFFSYRDRWFNFAEAAQNLRRVRDELDYAAASDAGVSKTQLDEFFERFQKILQEAHTGWLGKKEPK